MELELELNRQISYLEASDPDAINSIEWYTGGGFDEFNQALRQNKRLTPVMTKHLTNLDWLFQSVPPLSKALTLYKGIESDTVVSDKSFVSTTFSLDKALEFINAGEKCCLLHITVVPESKALPIWHYSREPDEYEVLLDRGGTLSVSGGKYYIRDNITVLYVTYEPLATVIIGDDSDIREIGGEISSKELEDRVYEILMDTYGDEDPDFISDLLDMDEIYSVLNEINSNIDSDKATKIVTSVNNRIMRLFKY